MTRARRLLWSVVTITPTLRLIMIVRSPRILACGLAWMFGCTAPPRVSVVEEPTPRPRPAVAAVPADDRAAAAPLFCAKFEDCRHRVQFAPKFSIYADETGDDALAADTQPQPQSWAQVVDPGATGSRVHLVCNSLQGYSTSVYIERDELAPVVTEFVLATAAAPGADAKVDPRIGVSLAPGTIVEVQETRGEQVKVAIVEEIIKGTGWMPARAIGKVYRSAEEGEDPRPLPNEGRREISWEGEAVPVRESPGGRTFATAQGPATVQPLAEPRDGHVLVAVNFWLGERTYAVGWVPQPALTRPRGVAAGELAGQPPEDAKFVAVAAGTRLQSAAGRDVGVTTKAAELECVGDCGSATPLVRLRCGGDFSVRVARSGR